VRPEQLEGANGYRCSPCRRRRRHRTVRVPMQRRKGHHNMVVFLRKGGGIVALWGICKGRERVPKGEGEPLPERRAVSLPHPASILLVAGCLASFHRTARLRRPRRPVVVSDRTRTRGAPTFVAWCPSLALCLRPSVMQWRAPPALGLPFRSICFTPLGWLQPVCRGIGIRTDRSVAKKRLGPFSSSANPPAIPP